MLAQFLAAPSFAALRYRYGLWHAFSVNAGQGLRPMPNRQTGKAKPRAATFRARYDDLEKRLAQGPVITVPTITLEGDANEAPHPDPNSDANKFSCKYAHRLIKRGVGHNLPQEAPQAFAKAIFDAEALD